MKIARVIFKWTERHKILSLVIAVVLLAAALFARSASNQSKGIVTAPVKEGNIVESVYGIGTVMANRVYHITPGVVYTVTDVYVKEGDTVRRGQKLLGSDTIDYRAPFAGTVTYLPVKVGDNVPPGVPILTLVDLSDRYLVVNLEQQGALRVQPGQKVKMSFDTIREESYDGTVQAVYSSENNFLARIDIEKLPARILPGMTADVAIEIEQHSNVLLVPVAALDHGNSVWIKEKHALPKKVEVKTGIVDKALAEIVQGNVKPGDRLLIREKK